jgi:hypothetical protein
MISASSAWDESVMASAAFTRARSLASRRMRAASPASAASFIVRSRPRYDMRSSA